MIIEADPAKNNALQVIEVIGGVKYSGSDLDSKEKVPDTKENVIYQFQAPMSPNQKKQTCLAALDEYAYFDILPPEPKPQPQSPQCDAVNGSGAGEEEKEFALFGFCLSNPINTQINMIKRS